MWKATAGLQLQNSKVNSAQAEDDDWETDPDFVNDVSEQEQRWGSKTIEGSGRTAGAIDMDKLRSETEKADQEKKRKQLEQTNPGYGYGGKFGVQTDRMDKSAVGHDYEGKVEKHASQKDYAAGFGGKFGIQTDRVDKSAAGWDHIEKLQKHASQKDYSAGFGGKFGVQTDRVDKSALGWDHIEKLEKHESQKDYAKGFGGKYGVQEDRKDKSAVGWDHKEATQKHESQVDHKIGFGGKFGIQKDRMDKSALKYDDDNDQQTVGTNYTKVKPVIENVKPSNLRAKFENLAKSNEEENRRRAAELKRLREAKDKREREESAKKPIVENQPVNSIAAENQSPPSKTGRSVIITGREGGIGNAISAFNQMQLSSSSNNTTSPARKEPIHLPKETVAVVENKESKEAANLAKSIETSKMKSSAPPPDLIPSIEINSVATPPELLLESQATSTEQENNELYQNLSEVLNQQQNDRKASTEPQVADSKADVNAEITDAEAIYANSENLADYIEDTHIYAVAIYDYQATDDDEISFDPDDVITHIEMIDEGWWRGLCKNRYGLFPANYVQVVNEITQT